MKKIGIITINDNNNYGNRLQNYATQEYLKKFEYDVETIKNTESFNRKRFFLLRVLKKVLKDKLNREKEINCLRKNCFQEFNKNITFSEKYVTPFSRIFKKYFCFIVGSDQVWNPKIARLRDVDLLTFAKDNQKISFSASFGVSELQNEVKNNIKNDLLSFKAISVREDAGKKIVEDITERKDVEVLIDPTMLLSPEEWDEVAKMPNQLNTDKYILNYFLGQLSEERKKEIEKIAKENNCEIINILDKNSPFYQTGPSEFLYLEKNAFLICTDSFHSSVFAILYDRPFIVFDREDNVAKMNSRIETLINKFNLKNRKFEGKITEENLKHDYAEAHEILEKEREKANNFLKNALDLE